MKQTLQVGEGNRQRREGGNRSGLSQDMLCARPCGVTPYLALSPGLRPALGGGATGSGDLALRLMVLSHWLLFFVRPSLGRSFLLCKMKS